MQGLLYGKQAMILCIRTLWADNDYQDLITRMAHSNQVDINISGAKNKMSYYTSIGYLNEQGIVLNSYLNRITSRTNVILLYRIVLN